jgi:hypothetical protein
MAPFAISALKAGPCADAAAGLATFFVSHKGKEQSGIDLNSHTIEGANGLERHGYSRLQIARPATPDRAIGQGT